MVNHTFSPPVLYSHLLLRAPLWPPVPRDLLAESTEMLFVQCPVSRLPWKHAGLHGASLDNITYFPLMMSGKGQAGLFNGLFERKQPWEMALWFLGTPVYSISKDRSPKKSEDNNILKGTFPCEFGSARILLHNLGITLPVILVEREQL